MQNRLIRLPRNVKQGIVITADIVMSVFATWLAFSLRLDSWNWPQGYQWHVYQLTPLLAIPIFARLGLYRAIFRYTGMSAMVTMAKAVALYGAILFFLLFLLQGNRDLRSGRTGPINQDPRTFFRVGANRDMVEPKTRECSAATDQDEQQQWLQNTQ